tara:strand:+ start:792 stop:1568 length:777 start_codon:yes stop_codon:yes gene_type:complete
MIVAKRPLLIAGNWKMHGALNDSAELVSMLKKVVVEPKDAQMLLCPPFTHLMAVGKWLKESNILLGAQNLSHQPSLGAYTGEIHGSMLKDVGCSFVIIGHSERRQFHGETDDLVAQKFQVAQAVGLTPILCVGETLEQHQKGKTELVVVGQMMAVLKMVGVAAFSDAVIAYEPIWAIGTGRTATPSQAQKVHALIRATIGEHDATISSDLRILYGGSVKSDNASELFSMDDIDGGLVGGASLKAEKFAAIFQAALVRK